MQRVDPRDVSADETDIVVVGPYALDKETVPDESLDFCEDLEGTDRSGIVYGVAGSGDDFYGKYFAVAIDKFEAQFEKSGATKGADGVKVNLSPDVEATEELQAFTKALIAKVNA